MFQLKGYFSYTVFNQYGFQDNSDFKTLRIKNQGDSRLNHVFTLVTTASKLTTTPKAKTPTTPEIKTPTAPSTTMKGTTTKCKV